MEKFCFLRGILAKILLMAERHNTPAECAAIGRNFERQKREKKKKKRVTTLIFVAESVLLQKKEVESRIEFIETAQYRHKKGSWNEE